MVDRLRDCSPGYGNILNLSTFLKAPVKVRGERGGAGWRNLWVWGRRLIGKEIGGGRAELIGATNAPQERTYLCNLSPVSRMKTSSRLARRITTSLSSCRARA